jgi:hypothetical protein
MAAGTPRWDAAELGYLREHYGVISASGIADALGRTACAVYGRAKKAGLTVSQGAPCTYFREVDSPVKAYVLGLLVADGWVDDENRVGIELAEDDRETVAIVRDELNPAGRLRVYQRTGGGRPRVRFQFGNAQLAIDLARHGVVPRKTGLEAWPEGLPAQFENSFICGYYDGDGHMRLSPRPYWTVCSATRAFLDEMRNRIEDATGVKMSRVYPQGPIWAISKYGEMAVRTLDDWLHRDVGGMARKRLPERALARYRGTIPGTFSAPGMVPNDAPAPDHAVLF